MPRGDSCSLLAVRPGVHAVLLTGHWFPASPLVNQCRLACRRVQPAAGHHEGAAARNGGHAAGKAVLSCALFCLGFGSSIFDLRQSDDRGRLLHSKGALAVVHQSLCFPFLNCRVRWGCMRAMPSLWRLPSAWVARTSSRASTSTALPTASRCCLRCVGCWYVPGAVTMQRTHVLLGQSQTCMENLQAYVLPNVHAAVHASSTAGGF